MTGVVTEVSGGEVMLRDDAARLDRRIRLLVQSARDNIEKLYQLVGDAKAGRIHESLEYASWPSYVADVFKVEWKIDRAARRELVAFLHGEGMSQRAIADVVDVGVGTVNRDLDAAPVPNGTPDLTEAEAVEVTASIRGWVDSGRQLGLGDAEIQGHIENAVQGDRPATTGRDGKTYARPEPKPARRPDIAIEARNLGIEAARLARRIDKLTDDDRFSRNRGAIRQNLSGPTRQLRKAVDRLHEAQEETAR